MAARSRLLFLLACCLLLALPAQAQTDWYFGRNKIQHEDFDWHVLETEHFDVYYYPEMQALAEHGAAFAEEAYADLEDRFGTSLTHRVPIIFYSSNLHFKQTNITPGFIPDGVGGFFEFLKGRVVIPANGNLHRFRHVVRHELVHVFTFTHLLRNLRDHRVPPERMVPLWFTEGLAEYWAGGRDYQHEMMLRDAITSNYLVGLESMWRIRGTYLMYKEGEAVMHFLSQTYGEEKILQLIENAWKDRDFENVMELVLQEEFDTIAERWDTWLREHYYPRLEGAQVPSLAAGTILTRGFNSKPTFYRHPDGTRTVYVTGNHGGYTNVFAQEVNADYEPIGEPELIVRGERDEEYEAFHVLDSRMDVSGGGRLAFVTKSGGSDVIHTYDVERGEEGPTYRFDDLVAIYSPSWSDDGRRLAFTAIAKSGFADLFVFDTHEERLRQLTDDPYDDRDPAWRPGTNEIAFSSDRTAIGLHDAYNLFLADAATGAIQYVTFGDHHDLSPTWSPDGRYLAFASTRREEATGRYSAQDLWVIDMEPEPRLADATASLGGPGPLPHEETQRQARRLTEFAGASYDPVWTPDDHLLFAAFEHGSFGVRHLADADSLVRHPREAVALGQPTPEERTAHWAFQRVGLQQDTLRRQPYERDYNLDVAQGGMTQSPVWGSVGGAVLVFSDLLGNDYWQVQAYTAPSRSGGDLNLLERLNLSVTRVQLHRRANVAYGAFRYAGRRYDITDPDVSVEYPYYEETVYGGFGAVSFPLSKFRRVEVSTSLAYSDKRVSIPRSDVEDNDPSGVGLERTAVLVSNSLSLVHDNALYGLNGPVAGWRAKGTAAYTTDLYRSNVSFFTLSADVRHYQRLPLGLVFASRGLAQINEGQRARLFLLGGSWDLRGQRFLSVRGSKLWFTSHELRVPILYAPSAYIPLLAPFGIANLRGALFVDAAHVWNEDYHDDELPAGLRRELHSGETLGALGAGLRLNLFGGFVLRYDIGYRYADGFREREGTFRQFFFGYDF